MKMNTYRGDKIDTFGKLCELLEHIDWQIIWNKEKIPVNRGRKKHLMDRRHKIQGIKDNTCILSDRGN